MLHNEHKSLLSLPQWWLSRCGDPSYHLSRKQPSLMLINNALRYQLDIIFGHTNASIIIFVAPQATDSMSDQSVSYTGEHLRTSFILEGELSDLYRIEAVLCEFLPDILWVTPAVGREYHQGIASSSRIMSYIVGPTK